MFSNPVSKTHLRVFLVILCFGGSACLRSRDHAHHCASANNVTC